MSNETEREAFEIAYTCAVENGWDNPKELARYIWDQAGAAYQRTQAQPADALVEGLETIALESTDEQARCCAHHYLAAYRAAQEKK